jgi:hypothetical protein
MKKGIFVFIILIMFYALTACTNQHTNKAGENTPDTSYTPEASYTIETSYTIAVITFDYHQNNADWINRLVDQHGYEKVIIYTWPPRMHNYTADETIEWINNIALNTDIDILIINPGIYGTDHAVSLLRKQRDDIFIVYLNYETSDIPAGVEQPFRNNTLAEAVINANMILETDINTIVENFSQKARELGADTLIYFYDTHEYGTHFIESYWHLLLREKSAEAGLLFVEVDIKGAIQCGSSYAQYMNETIPPLIEKYGENIVFFGLDNERVFWFWSNEGFVYLPIYQSWFEPTPQNIASFLSMGNGSVFCENTSDIPLMIEQINKFLNENNTPGRLTSFPMPHQTLFVLAAVEYGIKWLEGKVVENGINVRVLEQIMLDIITEHTGLHSGLNIAPYNKNGANVDNYVLVLLDYLVYNK